MAQVRHPGVTMMMQRDFTLMHRAAMICAKLPLLKVCHRACWSFAALMTLP